MFILGKVTWYFFDIWHFITKKNGFIAYLKRNVGKWLVSETFHSQNGSFNFRKGNLLSFLKKEPFWNIFTNVRFFVHWQLIKPFLLRLKHHMHDYYHSFWNVHKNVASHAQKTIKLNFIILKSFLKNYSNYIEDTAMGLCKNTIYILLSTIFNKFKRLAL